MRGHLSDGDLHAYLDGALDEVAGDDAPSLRRHVEACEACAARLAAASLVREQAASRLAGGAASPGSPPPLEMLRRRARAAGPTGAAAALSRRRRWAWAASVVVALGVGWGVRDGLGPREPSRDAGRGAERLPADGPSDQAAATPATAPRAGATPTPTGALADAAAEPPRVQVEADAEAPPTRVGVAPAVDGPTGRPGAVARSVTAPPGRGAGVRSERTDGAATAPARAYAPSGPDSLLAGGSELRGLALAASGGRKDPAPAAPVEEANAVASPPAELVVAKATSPRGDAADSAAERSSLASEAVGRPAPAPAADVRGRALEPPERRRVREAARTGAGDEAPREPADVVLAVAGLDVLAVAWGEVAPGRFGVRVRQRLSDGDTLALVVIPGRLDDEGAERALAAVLKEPLPPGWSRLVRVRPEARVVALGPVDAVELSRLVEGLAPW